MSIRISLFTFGPDRRPVHRHGVGRIVCVCSQWGHLGAGAVSSEIASADAAAAGLPFFLRVAAGIWPRGVHVCVPVHTYAVSLPTIPHG